MILPRPPPDSVLLTMPRRDLAVRLEGSLPAFPGSHASVLPPGSPPPEFPGQSEPPGHLWSTGHTDWSLTGADTSGWVSVSAGV